ncbi:MAG: hypothetical protein KAJ30_04330 [Candidatus Heimdallarchaeota archaeon]|nr:hypothetical protein [Candidatus Heimdallarchaeota archaeon]
MTTKVEKIRKPKGEDNFFEDIFDSFKQAIILLVMLIVYNLIPLGIAFGGYTGLIRQQRLQQAIQIY